MSELVEVDLVDLAIAREQIAALEARLALAESVVEAVRGAVAKDSYVRNGPGWTMVIIRRALAAYDEET